MMSLIGRPAPDFTAAAVMPDDSIKADFKLSDLKGRYVVLFFYPADFTFVCPTEILEFDRKLNEFKERGTEVVGVSVDSHHSHLAWKTTPAEKGGIGKVQYSLVADITKRISRDFGVLDEDAGVSYRGTFLIDKDGMIQHAVLNVDGLGRNIDEAVRMVDALQHYEKYGEVCPANWRKGQEAFKRSTAEVAEYLTRRGK
ncbi:MAG: redoxin domain-containing protein [Candidatus Eisenbacteria bacterium]|nr:redoxin domain-containing protein [Candidatus Eisenbacteria bacterium]